LNAEFLKEYQGALKFADVAVVFYSPDAVKIKQLEEILASQTPKTLQVFSTLMNHLKHPYLPPI
jgi:hypothetical protein